MAESEHSEGIHVEILSREHDLSQFISADDELTDYLIENALSEQEEKTSITHLLFAGKTIVGYFTLLNDSIRINIMDDSDNGPHQYSSFPALKIGRLSTHKDHESQGYGTCMIDYSVSYSFEILHYSGCRIMTVDSKKGCEAFYSRYGFKATSQNRDNFTPMYLDVGKFLFEIENGRNG